MAPQTPPPNARLHDVRCPHCGAHNQTTGNVCWMCRRKLSISEGLATARESKSSKTTSSKIAPPKFAPQTFSFSLASVFAVMTLVAVGLGLTQIEPGLGIGFIICTFPALVVTFIRTRAEHAQGGKLGWGETITTFILSTTAMFATIGITLIALLIALFVICLIIFTIDPIHI